MAGFVKLDCGIADSSLWVERDVRSIFITALVMASPVEITEPMPQYKVRSLDPTGWSVPPGWYGMVHAAGPGIVRRDGCDPEKGLDALEELGSPDPQSRSQDFDGRRLVRVDGGYLVLNYFKYRDRDYTAAERMRRMRAKKRNSDVTRNGDGVTPNVTHAESREQRAKAKADTSSLRSEAAKREDEQAEELRRKEDAYEQSVAVQFGDHWPDVTAFLATRSTTGRAAWVKVIGTLMVSYGPAIVAQACTDSLAAPDPIRMPAALRTICAGIKEAGVRMGQTGPAKQAGNASLFVEQIRKLITTNNVPGQAPVRRIAKREVEAIGPEVLRAYEAVGGAERFLSTTGDQISFLIRDFTQALEAVHATA